MSSTTAAAASGLAGGAWFGEIASALQGNWQAASGGLVENNNNKAAACAEKNRTATKKDEAEDVVACGGAISDATLYLLLDWFTPS